MPSPQNVRAETLQEVAITQDLAPSLTPLFEDEIERSADLAMLDLRILSDPTKASSDLAIK
jgi:hypothetical protein